MELSGGAGQPVRALVDRRTAGARSVTWDTRNNADRETSSAEDPQDGRKTSMNIMEVRIRIVNQGKLKAFAEVVFEGCFAIHDIKIIESRSGLFLAIQPQAGKRRSPGYCSSCKRRDAETNGGYCPQRIRRRTTEVEVSKTRAR